MWQVRFAMHPIHETWIECSCRWWAKAQGLLQLGQLLSILFMFCFYEHSSGSEYDKAQDQYIIVESIRFVNPVWALLNLPNQRWTLTRVRLTLTLRISSRISADARLYGCSRFFVEWYAFLNYFPMVELCASQKFIVQLGISLMIFMLSAALLISAKWLILFGADIDSFTWFLCFCSNRKFRNFCALYKAVNFEPCNLSSRVSLFIETISL